MMTKMSQTRQIEIQSQTCHKTPQNAKSHRALPLQDDTSSSTSEAGSILTSQMSSNDANDDREGSPAGSEMPTIFESARLYLEASSINPAHFIPPNGRDQIFGCKMLFAKVVLLF